MMKGLLVLVLVIFTSNLAHAETSFRERMERQKIDALRKQMGSEESIQKAAKDYEAVAITKMLQQLYAEVKIDPLFGNKTTENIYKDLLLVEYGKIVAEKGGIGIAKSLTKDIQKERK